ncbi:MAG: glycogen-debranching protein [Cyanobium sp. M30B3]|nr:MAG: glycogen-debranching protein [Cyanobium sp. M30B3]
MTDPHPALAAGSSAPLGATLRQGGVNFSIHARQHERVELCLFQGVDDPEPAAVIPFAGERHHSGSYWHGWLAGVEPGQLYGYRLPSDPDCLLLDPYALAVAVPQGYGRQRGQRRQGAPGAGGGWAGAIKSVVADPSRYDWQGDRPLRRPARETVIYELHLRGFTADPSSGVPRERAGTYAGLIEKIPYLQQLGITAVELLPVFAFDAQAAPPGLSNHWGYQPISVLAPHPGYAAGSDPLAALDQFRDLVKALHRAGIEVILDVVFNHTAEGSMAGPGPGPTLSYRGLAPRDYYLLQSDGGGGLADLDVTGCGNTLNANNPVVRRLIRHSLRHWVEHMHVDGFRFDLAAVLSRDEEGNPEPRPPILLDLDSDPVLAGTKLIAEAWDAAGLYEVGSFVGERWQEWNGRFRDDLRHFLKGDAGFAWAAAQRLIGSPDVYGQRGREAELSVNFITCHDGFTLADWVSYDSKHNGANGEDNRDGSDDNASWNCGVEGPTQDPEVLALRSRQMRNALCLLLLSAGTPMLAMGDEVGRSQRGNNNAYCQDNPLSWFDWTLVERQADLLRFTRTLNAFRQRRDVVLDHDNLSLAELLHRCALEWHGVEPFQPDWGPDSHSLAVGYTSVGHRFRLHLMVNAWWQPLRFALPSTGLADGRWHRWIDTALPSPDDIVAWGDTPPLADHAYAVQPRSVVALLGRVAEAS